MQRRALLTTAGLALTGGCTAIVSEAPIRPVDNTSNDKTSNNTADDGPSEEATPIPNDPDYFIVGYWLHNHPDDVDPYPTDKEPLQSNETLQNYFEDAVAQDKRSGSEDNPSGGRGDDLIRQISKKEAKEIVEDLEVVDYSDDSWKHGRFVDHEGTYIWLTVHVV